MQSARRQFLSHEKQLFKHICPILRGYAHLTHAELFDIAFSRSCAFVGQKQAWEFFSYRAIERKALRWATWWKDWDTNPRKRFFTPTQASVGHIHSITTRRRTKYRRAYLCHVIRQRGLTIRAIAARLEISTATVNRGLKMSFSFLKRVCHLVSVGSSKKLTTQGSSSSRGQMTHKSQLLLDLSTYIGQQPLERSRE